MGLQISPATIDFGDVTVGTPVFRTVTIENPSTSSVQVAQLSSSSIAFSVNAGTLPTTLPAGGSMQVQVRYDPGSTTDSIGQLSVNAETRSSGNYSGFVKLHGKGASQQAALAALSCSTSSMTGAGSDNCTVKLTAPAGSSGMAVNLASSNSAVRCPLRSPFLRAHQREFRGKRIGGSSSQTAR